MKGDKEMLMHSRSKRWLANITVVLLIFTLIPATAFAASTTSWSQAGYDNVSESWTPGNIVKYYEGSYVPYRANAEGYVPTGDYIDFDLDYLESQTGALGYDQASNWFIGPSVPYTGSPTIYTKADIEAYAQAHYSKSIIEPDTQFMGADAFTMSAPVELTSGGLSLPPGYNGDTLLRYHMSPNLLGYTNGDTTATAGSFINALMTWYGGDWTMYYVAHLAESGAPNLFEGGTVILGAGAYAGSSLHVTFSQAGEKTVPLPTRGLAKKDILVEKTWANINDATPVTIKLMGQKGAAGTPYVASTITLDGTVDSNANPEYAAWKGKFVNVPIYYVDGKDVFPITYSIVEDPVPTGFLTPVYGGSAVNGFTVYNERLYGSLTVLKEVETNGAIGLTVPDFSITITGPSYPSGDTKVFNQTNGMEQTWENLIPGTYTVTEEGIDAPWSVVVDPESYEVTGGEDTTVNVTVTNTYTPGSLTVLKDVETNDTVGLTIPDFSITITGPSYPNGNTKVFNQTNGMEQTWDNLIPGTYTVTESGIDDPWSVAIDPETYEVTGGEDTTVDVTVTNTFTPGSLTVLKDVETNGANGLTVPDFSITITGPSYPSGDTKVFNQTNGMEQTWDNLIPGTYTVTESGIDAPWSVVIDPETFDVVSGEDTTVDVTVTNTYAPGSLTVLKAVETNGAVGLTVPDFSITITGPSYPSGDTKVFNQTNGMEQTWDNLIPGTYTVTESGIDAPWSVVIDPETFDVVSGEDTTVDVTVTNTFATGSLTVLKSLELNGTIGLTAPDFSITITGPSYPSGNTKTFNQIIGMEQTWDNLIPGTYTVTESGIDEPWSVMIDPETYDVVSGENTTVDVTVTNTYTPGSLTVLKEVETNDAVGLDIPDFSITITGPSYPSGDTKVFNEANGMEQTWDNLIPGTYTVTEEGVDAPWGAVIDPETYDVTSGEDATVDVTVTNTYTPGSLTVLKEVETNDAVGLDIPDFSITITGPSYPSGDTKVFNEANGMEQTWDNLIPGTYTVTEEGVDAPWGAVIDPETYEVTSGTDTTVDVNVTNTYEPGSLTVLKAVETNGAVGLTVPDFSITITGPSYPSGDTKVFNQTNGMEQTWENLIPGTYTVTESGIDAPWSVVIEPETFDVTSGADTTVDVTVTNTFATGSLTVLKSLETNGVVGLSMQDFSITITGPSYPSGDTKVFNQTLGMEQTWENLIPGTYTITEPGIEAPWSVVIDPTTYEVLSGEDTTVDVTVTNTYTPGSLTVEKVVETNGAIGLVVPDFSITITGPSYPSGDTKVFNEANGMEQTWNGLIPGTYTVTEPGIEAPWSVEISPATYDVTSGEDTTVDVTVTNEYSTGSIEVTKNVVVITEDPTILVNYSFYAALFEDIDGTMVLASDVKELKVVESASTTVTFDDLVIEKTYYVFETDSEGNIIETDADGNIVTPIIPDWTQITYENAAVTLTPSNPDGEAAITNVFIPEDFPLFGSITVNKTVTVNGKPFASNRVFYVALFADKALTDMVSEIKPLKMNGNTSTTTEFLTDIDGNPLEAGTTYYIAETDKEGVPLTGTFEELGYEIDIDNTMVVITEEGTTVNIINKFKSEEFPLTGDNSNMNLWWLLAMLSVAGALVPFAFRRKEERND